MSVRPRRSPEVVGATTPYRWAGQLVGGELRRVEAKLLELCGAGDEPLSLAARSGVEAGGKRLRPTLALLCARAAGEPTEATISLAMAVEVIHLASLMHDDVVDEAAMRRGRPSVRQRWGNRIAVLVGDFLAARAYHELAGLEDRRTLQILADAAMDMCRAETGARLVEGHEPDVEVCLEVARGKTASLIAASCLVGALSAGADPDSASPFRQYGEALGLAFQLTDDLLDIYGDETRLGKSPGRDIATGELTLPIALALRSERAEEVRRALADIAAADDPAPWLPALAGLVGASGAREAVRRMAAEYAHAAQEALRAVPDARPDAIMVLDGIAHDVVGRSH